MTKDAPGDCEVEGGGYADDIHATTSKRKGLDFIADHTITYAKLADQEISVGKSNVFATREEDLDGLEGMNHNGESF